MDIAMKPRTVATFLVDGCDDIAAVAPSFVFSAANEAANKELYATRTVSVGSGVVRTISGVKIHTDHTDVLSAPVPDILVLAGPNGNYGPSLRKPFSDWLTAAVSKSDAIVAICSAVRFLYDIGVSTGLMSVSHHAATKFMRRAAPDMTVRTDILIADHGNIVTSARLNGPIESSLYLIERSHGREFAEAVAVRIEYEPLIWRDPGLVYRVRADSDLARC